MLNPFSAWLIMVLDKLTQITSLTNLSSKLLMRCVYYYWFCFSPTTFWFVQYSRKISWNSPKKIILLWTVFQICWIQFEFYNHIGSESLVHKWNTNNLLLLKLLTENNLEYHISSVIINRMFIKREDSQTVLLGTVSATHSHSDLFRSTIPLLVHYSWLHLVFYDS